MKTLLVAIVVLFSITSFAQTDSSKIYNSIQLKKGFYRNYNDYIDNSPFIVADFDIIPYRLSKKDTIIIAGEYRFGESKTQIPNTWGFCDGKSVYIHFPNDDLNTLFYKLEKIGPYPYFMYVEKKIW